MDLRRRAIGWLLLLPAALVMSGVALLPTALTVGQSFYRVTLTPAGFASTWAGLRNYGLLLASDEFRQALAFTLLFTVATVAAELLLGLLLALAIRSTLPGRGLVRTLMLVPWALITVVSAEAWRFIDDGTYGVANAILMGLGLIDHRVAWLSQPGLAVGALMVADVWKTVPFVGLLLLAGLETIPDELHEASRIDGASGWRGFWTITLPLLRPSILLALLYRTIQAFVGLFDLPFVMTGGGPGYATESVAIYAWKQMFQNLRFGEGAAASVFAFLVALALALLYVRLVAPSALGGEEA
ncbi:MAG: sugar ABC transporter permease [Bacillota bacterium]|nr:sugar ABC transporter permease [Bacillota bacterium]